MSAVAGIITTIVIIGVLGSVGITVFHDTVESNQLSSVISETFNEMYSGTNVSGMQTIDVPDGEIKTINVSIINNNAIHADEQVTNGDFEIYSGDNYDISNWTEFGTPYRVQYNTDSNVGTGYVVFMNHNAANEAGIMQSVDLSYCDELTFNARSSYTWGESGYVRVYIDSDNVWSQAGTGIWLEQSVDVSSYTGIHTLKAVSYYRRCAFDNFSATNVPGPVTNTFFCNVSNVSESRSTNSSVSWTMNPEVEATEIVLDTDSTDYSYNISSSITSTTGVTSDFQTAQDSFASSISNSMVMSGTMVIVIIAVGIVFLVGRLLT